MGVYVQSRGCIVVWIVFLSYVIVILFVLETTAYFSQMELMNPLTVIDDNDPFIR